MDVPRPRHDHAAPTADKVAERTAAGSNNRSTLQSVERAFVVLDAIAASVAPRTAAELALAVGIDRTIVHRILRTLLAEEMVEETHGRYRIGPRALVLGNAYHETLTLRSVALPYMVDFVRTLGDRQLLVSVSILVRGEIALVDQVWNPGMSLDFIFGQGSRFPADRTASGRALMAYMPEEDVVAAIGPERAAELGDDFAEIRNAGGIEFQRSPEQQGNCAIAAVIFPRTGQRRGTLILSGGGLEDHLVPGSPLAGQVRRYADRIGDQL